MQKFSKDGLPRLPIKGINPYETIKEVADRTYIAYFGGRNVVDSYLKRHMREDQKSYNYRKSLAYTTNRTKWATNYITRTVDNAKYPVTREFSGNAYLDTIAKKRTPSGDTWDSKLKDALIEGLLGGVAYIYIDFSTLMIDNDSLTGNIDVDILRVNQVENIVLDNENYITQAEVFTVNNSETWLYRFYNLPDEAGAETPYYSIYKKDSDQKPWELIEENINTMGVVPIVPIIPSGDLNDPHTIISPIQEISAIDIDIMNLLSDSRHAFGMHNYPWVALPTAEGILDDSGVIVNDTKAEYFSDDESIKTVALGEATGFEYNAKDGQPLIIEPQNIHVDQTIKLIEFLKEQILDIIGVGIDKDHPLSSGVAKMFTFNDSNEAFRRIHSKLEDIEYSVFYIINYILNPSQSNFNDFRSQIGIRHPTNFDPTGGVVYTRLKEAVESPSFAEGSDESKTELIQQYTKQVLVELLEDEKLKKIIKTIKIEKEEQQDEAQNKFVQNNEQPITTPPTIEDDSPIQQQ